jgi:hypothetical protein
VFQLRKVVVRGSGVPDAVISFVAGANILAGVSDTGKSYLLHCLDYIFGAEKMAKRFPKAEPYSQLYVQFENDEGKPLTLQRSLSGGDLTAYRCAIEAISGGGEKIVPRRFGKSLAKDVTSVLFPFADLPDAQLRKNKLGETQRLTIRHFAPVVLVDEVGVIDERSPVRGPAGYDKTANERAFAFMLSGKDDASVTSAERNDIIRARLNAKLAVIDELLKPLEGRLQSRPTGDDETIEKVEAAITDLSVVIQDHTQEHNALLAEREIALGELHKAEGQVLAIDELLTRYRLLDARYITDLDRLDFIAEGAYYFGALQAVACPLCDQPMGETHSHDDKRDDVDVQVAARAEAAKILALRADLTGAIESVTERRRAQTERRDTAKATLQGLDDRVRTLLTPAIQDASDKLARLVERRVALEAARSDREQAEGLRAMRESIEQAALVPNPAANDWEALPFQALDELCLEIQAVLADWHWPAAGRVTFDQNAYDIIVDGQPRQSHGKGVRGVLYSAFVIGLLRYCKARGRPHPGMVVIDSPLTAFSKQRATPASLATSDVSPGVEAAFWESLKAIGPEVQVIVVENKRPPIDVAEAVRFIWFAGEFAEPGQRFGFFP